MNAGGVELMRREGRLIALSEGLNNGDLQQDAYDYPAVSQLQGLIAEDDEYWKQHETAEIKHLKEQISRRRVESTRLRWLLTRFLVGSVGTIQITCGLVSLVFRHLGLEVSFLLSPIC